ncbi:SRPBCC family protein [Streptomyces roseifaciens]|uniref:SRPBCC family protein n=1 Tax=Streptomyces roseifaciens TaxID=1488406 RepID=UPI0007180746|nr:SRPBCC family protein [Streptomyces roseifaciens]
MIDVSHSIPVNDGPDPTLSIGDVWRELERKAHHPDRYVRRITECRVTERFDGGLVRDFVLEGEPVRELVTFYPQQRIHFVRTLGRTRGTIDNEITTTGAGALVVAFHARLVIDGTAPGSTAERQRAERLKANYTETILATLATARSRLPARPGTT